MLAVKSKSLLAAGGLGMVVLALGSLAPGLIGANFHTVTPERVYRSGQLTPEEVEERIADYGLRSIINLRGDEEDRDWYQREAEVPEQHGLTMTSLDFLPERLPPRPLLIALIDALETLPEPILVHCSAGADCAGSASVLARMALGAQSSVRPHSLRARR